MKRKTRLLSLLLIFCMLAPMLPVAALPAFASDNNGSWEDAMIAIKNDATLSAFQQGETQAFNDDGYIGIPYEITVYYDNKTHGAATPGYMTNGATPVVLYVVNANFERIGTDSDVSIIRSLLERGYVVAVLDYLNNEKAASPALDYSAQLLRSKLAAGAYFKDSDVFHGGQYEDNIIVPSGYNIRLNDVYFELDKHGSDGTLDFILLKWNTDLRYHKADTVIKWVREDGSRKATQNGYDNSAPVWYSDASGKTQDAENGQYIKLKHTLAEDIADCVKPDGTPIDLNLYLHVLYPTNPEKEVPVMAMLSSAHNLLTGSNVVDRPHLQGYLFNGYACVLFDYALVPMNRNDHYTNYGSDKTGYGMGYGVYYMNATTVPSAAIRYTRYLALNDPDTYAFDIEKIGLFGISKAAWMTHLGSPRLTEKLYTSADGTPDEVEELVNDKISTFHQIHQYQGHHGETRYDNGITDPYTKNGVTIDGGTRQPWLVYEGNEIRSDVQAIYSATGGVLDYLEPGTAPMFSIENFLCNYDTQYSNVNKGINLCRLYDIPIYWYEANIGHTFAYGPDYNYGVDTYDALFKFSAYYLQDAPVSVTYTNPIGGSVVRTTDGLTVKFIGEVSADEIAKVSVTDADGNAVNGEWSGAYGDTEWTFTPYDMKGGKYYTLTVPATLKGKNGVEMGKAYTTTFYARPEHSDAVLNENVTLTTEGTPIKLTIPDLSTANSFYIRLRVDSATANEVEAYDAETNELIGSVRVHGAGYYEIDATEYVAGYEAGTQRWVVLKTVADVNDLQYEQDFDSGRGDFTKSTYASITTDKVIDGETVVGVTEILHNYRVNELKLYTNCEGQWAVKNSVLMNGGQPITDADMGRTFNITIRVYDTVDRFIFVWLNGATSKADARIDYDWVYHKIETRANEWVEFTIPYTVYETKYALSQTKELNFHIPVTGNTEKPIYIDSITVEEVFEPITVGSVSLVGDQSSNKPVKAPEGTDAFLVNGETYATWKEAMNAATSACTVKLLSNYTLTDSDLVNLSGKTALTIDLNGYRLLAKTTENAPLWMGVTNTAAATLTLKNGSVVLFDTALIAHDGSTSAGSGKSISILLEDLYITVAEDAVMQNVIHAGSITSGVSANVDVTLTDTVIDLTRKHLPFRAVEIFSTGNADVDVSYTMCGGEFRIDRVSNRTVFCNSLIEAAPNANGEYPTFYCSAWDLSALASFIKDGEYSSLKAGELVNGYRAYTLGKADIVTDYGAVPEAKVESTFYIFQDGKFIGDADTWIVLNKLVREALDLKPQKAVSVLMTKDHTVTGSFGSADWMAQMNGDVLYDLGGHTIIADAAVFEVGIHKDYTAGKSEISFTVKNGTVLGGKGNIFVAQNQTADDKKVNFTFEGVRFGINEESFATNRDAMFRANGGSVAGTLAIKMSFTDCTFDFRGVPASLQSYRMFYAPGNNTAVNFDASVYGGKLIADSLDNIKWYDLDNGADTLRFVPDEEGNYVTLDVPNGVKPNGTVPTDGGIVSFSKLVTDGELRDVYTISNESIETEYGLLPWGAAGSTFVLFKDGQFLAGVDTWKQANATVRARLDEDPGCTIIVLMQRNHSVTENFASTEWYGFMNGHVVYDLGGNTLIGEKTIFEAGVHKDFAGGNYETTFTVKNGTILGGAGYIFAAQNKTAYDKDISFTFQNIDFGLNSTIASNRDSMFMSWSGNTSGTETVTMTFTDCTFDLRNWPTTNSTYRLFYSPANNNTVSFDVKVYGCELIADSFGNISVSEFDQTGDIVVFEPDENDKYITLSVPNGVNPASSSVSVPTADGTCIFADLVTDGADRDIYAISVGGTVTTEYGRIPAENIGNVFAIFKDGSFIAGADTWKQANIAVRKALDAAPGSTVIVLMRKNHSVTENFASTEWYGFMKGHVVFDLGGNTLIGEKTIFEAGIHASYTGGDYETSFTVKNGTILSGAGFIFTAQNKTAYDKEISFTFQNIDFGLNSTIASNRDSMFMAWSGSNSGVEKVTMTFTDCTFDLRGWKTSYNKPYRLFQAPTNNKTATFDVKVYGCEILADSLGYTTFCAFDMTNDIVCFLPDANGKTLTLSVPNGIVPAVFLPTKGGFAGFKKLLSDGADRDVYELESLSDSAPLTTPYGTIPADKESAALYPFALFDGSKNFIAAANDWKALFTAANTYLSNNPGATVYVLMRTNYEVTAAPSTIGNLNGTLVLDLDGYTLTRATVTMLEACTSGLSADQCAYSTSIVIKNGTIIATNKSNSRNAHLISYRSNGSYDKTIDITFDTVKFAFANVSGGDVRAYAIIANGVSPVSGATGVISSDLRLKNCTFDFTGSAGTSKPSATNIFNLQGTAFSDTSDIDLIFEGGSIEGDAGVLSQIACLNNNFSTKLLIAPNANGEYLKFHLTGGTGKVPSEIETVDGETLYYAESKSESINGTTWYTYTARPNVLLTGASVSLGQSLSIRYYVSILKPSMLDLSQLSMRFEMNGKVTVVTDYEMINGEYVFCFEGIAPQQMADLIDATLLMGDTVLAVQEDYSIKQNCIALLNKTAEQLGLSDAQYAALRTLVSDLLVYGAAAQNYKDYNLGNLANKDLSIELTPSDALPTESDKSITASTSTNVYFTSATVWFDNVNKIGVKLSTIENVTLKVNGVAVELNGTTYYTDAVYATGFDTVYTFELYEGETLVQTLAYSVSSYAYAMMNKVDGEGNLTEMAELARALYRYGVSAVAYKNA